MLVQHGRLYSLEGNRRKQPSVNRPSAIKPISSFRTASDEAAVVLAKAIPIDISSVEVYMQEYPGQTIALKTNWRLPCINGSHDGKMDISLCLRYNSLHGERTLWAELIRDPVPNCSLMYLHRLRHAPKLFRSEGRCAAYSNMLPKILNSKILWRRYSQRIYPDTPNFRGTKGRIWFSVIKRKTTLQQSWGGIIIKECRGSV